MYTLSSEQSERYDALFKEISKQRRVLQPLATLSSLVHFVALMTLCSLAIYCVAYHLSLFDSSIRKFSHIAIGSLSGSSPFLLYAMIKARQHQKAKGALQTEVRSLFQEKLNPSDPETIQTQFILEHLLKTGSRTQKKYLISEWIRMYPKKKNLMEGSHEKHCVAILTKVKEILSKGNETSSEE